MKTGMVIFTLAIIAFCTYGFALQLILGNYGLALFQALLIGINVWSFERSGQYAYVVAGIKNFLARK